MQTYSLDIDPEQLVFWTRAELARRPSSLRTYATCGREVRRFDRNSEYARADGEDEDIHEIATVATLEISPGSSADGWSISILVEDEPGESLAEEGNELLDAEIDLDTFHDLFLKPDRGIVYVTATVDNEAAQSRAVQFLSNVLNDRHNGNPLPGRH